MTRKPKYEDLERRVKILEKIIFRFESDQKRLRDLNQQWEAIFEAIDDPVCLLDAESKILRCNKAMLAFLEKPASEVLDQQCWELVHGTTKPIEGCPIVRVWDTKRREATVLPIRDKWFEVVGHPQMDAQGNIIGVVHVLSEITEHKRAEEGLKESAKRSRELADLLPQPVFEIDGDGFFTYANQCGLDTFGYTLEDLKKGVHALQLFDPEERRRVAQNIKKRLTGVEFEDYEYIGLRKDGSTFPFLLYTSPIIRDNKTVGVRGILLDMTKQKQTERAIQESERRYRLLAENVTDVIWAMDMNLKYTYISPSVTRLRGYSVDEVMAQTIEKIMTPASVEIAMSTFSKALEKIKRCEQKDLIKSYILELELNCKDGSTVWTEVKMNFLFDSAGNPTGIIGVTRDIAKRKRAEEALRKAHYELEQGVIERTAELKEANENLRKQIELCMLAEEEKAKLEAQLRQTQKMQAIGILSGGIAHDFNNILGAILGYIELSLDDVKPGNKIYDNLSEAIKSCIVAKDLTNQFLLLSKAGQPLKKTASLLDLIRNSTKLALSGSNVSCEFLIPDELWLVDFDEGQIRQVFNCLITNAKEAMPQGGMVNVEAENVTIDAEDKPGFKAGKYVKIAITDYGVGISEEHLDKIFDPYFSTKKMGIQKGMGLGLTTVYSIIEKHKGHIEVESKVGKGTSFIIYLPASESKKEIIAEKSAEKKIYTGKGRVLVMEDEQMLRDVIEKMVSSIMGYNVVAVKEGVEAIETYKNAYAAGKPFDAVILDLTVKNGMGGKETIEELLKIDPGVKAIVSSGYSGDPIMTDYKRFGFKSAIPKPYSLSELGKVLSEVIKGK